LTFGFTEITSLHIKNQMSIDYLLYNAAKNGDVEEVKELLSKGASATFKDEVCYFLTVLSVYIYVYIHIYIYVYIYYKYQ